MKLSYLLSFILLIFSFAISSCRLPCDGFPKKELKWIPYAEGDSIKYKNGTDTISFVVSKFYKSERSTERTFPVMDVECGENAYYETELNAAGYALKETLFSYPYKFAVQIQSGIELSFSKDSKNQSYYTSKEVSGVVYDEVYIVDVDLNITNGSITSFALASGYGIIEFHDSAKQKTWSLIHH